MTATELDAPPEPLAQAEGASSTDLHLPEVSDPARQGPPIGRPSYRELAGLLPGLGVLTLGLLYATGALIKTAQLRDAGIRVGDALPLVPIEQLLALGIGTMMQALYIVILWALGAALWVYFAHRRKVKGLAREPDPPPDWAIKHQRLIRYGFAAFFALLALSMLTHSSIFTVVAALAPAWFFGSAGREQERGNVRGIIKLWVMAYSIVVAAKIAGVWYNPMPLPTAFVQTRDAVIEGPMIVAKGDAWYVARPDGKSFEAIVTARIVSASVESPPPPDDHPAVPLPWP